MKYVYAVAGVAYLVFGGILIVESRANAPWNTIAGSAIIVGAAVLLAAAKRGFNGGWRFLVGVTSTVFGLMLALAFLDFWWAAKWRNWPTRQIVQTGISVPTLVGLGALLIRSGLKRHRARWQAEADARTTTDGHG